MANDKIIDLIMALPVGLIISKIIINIKSITFTIIKSFKTFYNAFSKEWRDDNVKKKNK